MPSDEQEKAAVLWGVTEDSSGHRPDISNMKKRTVFLDCLGALLVLCWYASFYSTPLSFCCCQSPLLLFVDCNTRIQCFCSLWLFPKTSPLSLFSNIFVILVFCFFIFPIPCFHRSPRRKHIKATGCTLVVHECLSFMLYAPTQPDAAVGVNDFQHYLNSSFKYQLLSDTATCLCFDRSFTIKPF